MTACPVWIWVITHRHTHTQRNGLGCQRCQWGLQMREDHHTLHSSNGQADGRLLCSLCLGWWLYSSGCYALPAALHQAAIYGVLFLPHTFLCFSLPLLFICTFFSFFSSSSLGLFFYSLWVCLGSVCLARSTAVSFQLELLLLGEWVIGSVLESVATFRFFSFFLADQTFGHAKTFQWQRKSHWTESNFNGIWDKASLLQCNLTLGWKTWNSTFWGKVCLITFSPRVRWEPHSSVHWTQICSQQLVA